LKLAGLAIVSLKVTIDFARRTWDDSGTLSNALPALLLVTTLPILVFIN
jgi:hypothetical protein